MSTKLLGQAEIIRERVWVRLSRKADPTRKRILIEDPSITTKEQGQIIAHEMSVAAIAEKLRRARPAPPPSTKADTVEAWCDLWHADRVKRKIVTTDRHDRGRLKEHVFPIIRTMRMADVTREEIESIVVSLDQKIVAGEISWKTAATTWGVVSKMFEDAKRSKNPKLRVRDDDPTVDVEPPERGDEKAKAFLYPSEFLKLVTSRTLTHGEGLPRHLAANVARASRRWLRSFTLAIYLGTRAGELRALKWEDIDLDHWVAHVHIATKRDTGGKVEKGTKTGITRRFEIEPELRPLLLAMHAEAAQGLPPGKKPTGPVIDLPMENDLSERLQRYLRWAGVDRAELFISDATRCAICFKDLRATWITWRAIRGDDPLKIQRAAGHKDLSTTQIYIRVAEDIGGAAGQPFPPLPPFLLGAPEAPPPGSAGSRDRGAPARPTAGPRVATNALPSVASRGPIGPSCSAWLGVLPGQADSNPAGDANNACDSEELRICGPAVGQTWARPSKEPAPSMRPELLRDAFLVAMGRQIARQFGYDGGPLRGRGRS